MTNTSRTKMYQYILYKDYFNKFVSVSRLRRVRFLDHKYEEEDLGF